MKRQLPQSLTVVFVVLLLTQTIGTGIVTPTLAERDPAAYFVDDVTISPETVDANEPATVSFTLRNLGDRTGYKEVGVFVGNNRVFDEKVYVRESSSKRVNVTFTPSDENLTSGTYNVTVLTLSDESDPVQVTITDQRPAPTLTLEQNATGTASSPVRVNATVGNTGDARINGAYLNATTSANLSFTPSSANKSTFLLDPIGPNESRTITYVVSANNSTTGTLSVNLRTREETLSGQTTVRIDATSFLEVADTDNDRVIDPTEVIRVISIYNRNEMIGGYAVTEDRVLRTISAYNAGKQV